MAAGLVRVEEGPVSPVTVLTVSDSVWDLHIQTGEEEDPLRHDPVFQRQVVSTQLVLGRIDGGQAGPVKTVGGRSLLVRREAERLLTVNDVPVLNIISVGNSEVTGWSFTQTDSVLMCLNVS